MIKDLSILIGVFFISGFIGASAFEPARAKLDKVDLELQELSEIVNEIVNESSPYHMRVNRVCVLAKDVLKKANQIISGVEYLSSGLSDEDVKEELQIVTSFVNEKIKNIIEVPKNRARYYQDRPKSDYFFVPDLFVGDSNENVQRYPLGELCNNPLRTMVYEVDYSIEIERRAELILTNLDQANF